jgi:hypothetical protein
MKRLILYILLLLVSSMSLLLYAGAVNEDIFNALDKSGIVNVKFVCGDLYSNTLIPKFKDVDYADSYMPEFKPTFKDSNLVVYLEGDSYTQAGRVDAKHLAAGEYHYGLDQVDLDSTKTNILILSKTERYFIKDIEQEYKALHNTEQNTTHRLKEWVEHNPNPDLFNTQDINQRLEYLISNNTLVTFLKERKSMLLYELLGETNNQVVVSEKYRMVYLRETTDPHSTLSPYCKLDSTFPAKVIDVLNHRYARFKAMGFDEVYFAPIPEKTRLFPYHDHIQVNNLFDLLQQDAFRMPYLNVHSKLKNAKELIYAHCDTHWNRHGINVWLSMVDSVLHVHSTQLDTKR